MKRLAIAVALALAVALPLTASAKPKSSPMPGAAAGLSAIAPTCPASDPVVWVNTSSKIYWAPGTKYYGKTKKGGYACTSAAVAMGARPAKPSPIGHGMTTAAPDATTAPMSKKKHHKAGAMPLPSPSP